MAKDYKVESLMICDDVRSEANGKEIIIGLYKDEIIFDSLPAMLPTLAFRVAVRVAKQISGNMVLEVSGPDKKALLRHEVDRHVYDAGKLFGMVVHMSQVPFDTAGEYGVWFGINRKPEKIGTFTVRQGPVPK